MDNVKRCEVKQIAVMLFFFFSFSGNSFRCYLVSVCFLSKNKRQKFGKRFVFVFVFFSQRMKPSTLKLNGYSIRKMLD